MCFSNLTDYCRSDEVPKPRAHTRQEVQDGLVNLMTIMYMFIQVVLGDPEGMDSLRDQLSKWNRLSMDETSILSRCSIVTAMPPGIFPDNCDKIPVF